MDGRVIRRMSHHDFSMFIDTIRAVQFSRTEGVHRKTAHHSRHIHAAHLSATDDDSANKRLLKKAGERFGHELDEELKLLAPRPVAQSSVSGRRESVVQGMKTILNLAQSHHGLESSELKQALKEAFVTVLWDLKLFVKPMLAFVQIQSSIDGNRGSHFNSEYPQFVLDILAPFRSVNLDFNFDPLKFASEPLRGVTNYANRSILYMCAFGSLVMGMYLGTLAVVFVAKLRARDVRSAHRSMQTFYDRMITFIVLVIFVLYPVISLRLLKLYQTHRYVSIAHPPIRRD